MAMANERARVSSTGMSSAARVCSCEFAWCKAASDDELSKLTVHFLPSAGHHPNPNPNPNALFFEAVLLSRDPSSRDPPLFLSLSHSFSRLILFLSFYFSTLPLCPLCVSAVSSCVFSPNSSR